MLPRKLHLEQIDKLHDGYILLNKQIESETDAVKQYELLTKFRKIVKIWSEVDDFVETLKYKLDQLEIK